MFFLRFVLFGIFGLCFGTASAAQSTDRYIRGPIDADVVNVIDGDTIEVTLRPWLFTQVRTRIRIRGIDTPETNRAECAAEAALGMQATQHVTRLLLTGGDNMARIVVTDITPDKYSGRVLAEVIAPNGVDVAHSLLDHGLALPYDGGPRPNWCA